VEWKFLVPPRHVRNPASVLLRMLCRSAVFLNLPAARGSRRVEPQSPLLDQRDRRPKQKHLYRTSREFKYLRRGACECPLGQQLSPKVLALFRQGERSPQRVGRPKGHGKESGPMRGCFTDIDKSSADIYGCRCFTKMRLASAANPYAQSPERRACSG